MMQAINDWARRTGSSFVGSRPELEESAFPRTMAPAPDIPGDLIYRLRRWPELPSTMRTAEVLRLLSLMSSRPLRRSWILQRTRLVEKDLERLTRRLARDGSLDILDPSLLPSERPA